jgi:hypothetical protein
MYRRADAFRFVPAAFVLAMTAFLSGGCSVISVTTTAVGVAASGVGLAVDAGVGAARITGKAIGATVDAVTPSGAQ